MKRRSMKKTINKILDSEWYYFIMFWEIGIIFLLVVEIICFCYRH